MSAIILFCLAVRRRTLDRQSRVSKDADILLSAFFAWRLVRGEIIELTERTEDGLGVMSVVVRGLDRGLSSYIGLSSYVARTSFLWVTPVPL